MFTRITTFPRLPLRRHLAGARFLSGADKTPPPPPLPPVYRQLDNLDFPTAAKILFTEPPKKKKFGFDFHLVQFFFACMPSLAVYLVAQYARYEIRRMEAPVGITYRSDFIKIRGRGIRKPVFVMVQKSFDLAKEVEKKKKAEEEEKAREAESVAEEEDSKLSEVLVRLDALEETVKEIVDKKKPSEPDLSKDQSGAKKDNSATVDKDQDQKINSKLVKPTLATRKDVISHSSPLIDVTKKDKNQV